jgi:hypothetical protein
MKTISNIHYPLEINSDFSKLVAGRSLSGTCHSSLTFTDIFQSSLELCVPQGH